jgi:hypothetical protein
VQTHLPLRRLAIGVVDDAGDALDAIVPNQIFELLFKAISRFEIRDFCNDDNVGVLFGFKMRCCPQRDRRAAR